MTVRSILCAGVLLAAHAAAFASPTFNFNASTSGTALPVTLTDSGLTATFSGSGHICDVSAIGFMTLSGNALIQNLCATDAGGSIAIAFSSDITGLNFNFATAAGPGTLSVLLLEAGVPVGTRAFVSTVPPGGFNAEGLATINGATFNSVVLSSTVLLAIDNLVVNPSAVPEPETLAMLSLGLVLLGVTHRRRRR